MTQEMCLIGIVPKIKDPLLREPLQAVLQRQLSTSRNLLLRAKTQSSSSEQLQNLDYLLTGKWEYLHPEDRRCGLGSTEGESKQNSSNSTICFAIDDLAICANTIKSLPRSSTNGPFPPKQRPRSASAVNRRRGPSINTVGTNVIYSSYYQTLHSTKGSDPIDLTFVLVGRVITLPQIDLLDRICYAQEKVLFAQRYWCLLDSLFALLEFQFLFLMN